MTYTKEFFEFQLQFAERVALVSQKNIEGTLLEYTNFYKAFNIQDWEFNPENPIWKSFIQKFISTDNKLDAIYNYYLENIINTPEVKLFGFFSYDFEKEENYIQIHFKGNGQPNALSVENIEKRKMELNTMFTEIKEKHPDVEKVCGFSWLYNLDSYKRLFPTEYTSNLKTVPNYFKTLAIWGQFVDYKGNLRTENAEMFKTCIKQKESLEGILFCFPYYILEPESDIKFFYKFYNVI